MVTYYSIALTILGRLHCINADMLGWWLCERQLPSGGLNSNRKTSYSVLFLTDPQMSDVY